MPALHTPFRHLALLLALGGCASVGPDYRAPDLPLPAAWSGTASAQPTADLGEWWTQLRDPLLDQLIGQALSANLDLQTARSRLRQARAQRGLAGAEQAPSVSASASTSRTQSDDRSGGDTRNAFSAGFDAAWEPDVFGGIRRGVEAAEADLQGTAASLEHTRVSLVAEVARNYVELCGYQARLRIAERNLAAQAETLQLTEWRAQAGLGSRLEVEQARTNLAQTRAQIPTLRTSLSTAEHALAVLLGQPPAALQTQLTTAGVIPPVADALAVGIPAETLRRRPDVIAAERKLAAETARIGVAEAARYPGFNLSGSIGLDALKIGDLLSSASLGHSLLASLSAPLLDGGRLRQRVEIQNATQEQARLAYQSTVLTALQEVENALVTLANSRQRLTALDAAADSARNAALLARQRYSSGLIDFQTVLDSERSLLSVEDSQASAEVARVTALIQLYKALGGGWSAPTSNAIERNPS